ncbi:hypothetical protein [Agathobaculum sp.]
MKKNRLIQTTACAMALSAALTVSAFAATNAAPGCDRPHRRRYL